MHNARSLSSQRSRLPGSVLSVQCFPTQLYVLPYPITNTLKKQNQNFILHAYTMDFSSCFTFIRSSSISPFFCWSMLCKRSSWSCSPCEPFIRRRAAICSYKINQTLGWHFYKYSVTVHINATQVPEQNDQDSELQDTSSLNSKKFWTWFSPLYSIPHVKLLLKLIVGWKALCNTSLVSAA